MANNLFVSYDLYSPGQKYDAVINAIKALGNWAKVHKSLWYVNSHHTAASAAQAVWQVMDRNDTLIVINATSNDAYWYNLSNEVGKYLQDHWHR